MLRMQESLWRDGRSEICAEKQGGKKAKILCPLDDFSRYETQDTSSQVKKQ